MTEETQIRNALNFIKKVEKLERENLEQFFAFLAKFSKQYDDEERKLPYHINLIDELRADENAHSRILGKLLKQQNPDTKRFEILESFIRFIVEKYKNKGDFQKIEVNNPEITPEEKRIDLWIRDEKEYAIIIENKIGWAPDQTNQIERYIEITKKEGFKDEQIYVLYLPPTYEKEPDEQTWGGYLGGDIYKNRYLNLSFRDDILPWLKNGALQDIKIKNNKYLLSALEQYIDHLEGKFFLRTINNKMNMKLQEIIKEELGLKETETPQKNIAKLVAQKEEIEKLSNQIDLLRGNFETELFQKWQTELETKYPQYLPLKDDQAAGLKFPPIKGVIVEISVWVVSSTELGCGCQVDTQTPQSKRNLPQEVKNKVEKLLDGKAAKPNEELYKGLPRYNYDEAFRLLCSVIAELDKIK